MTMAKGDSQVRFGHTELPDEQKEALRTAVKFEWITIGFLAASTALVFAVLGNSQAMKAAWVEDVLSFLPPISFLLAVRVIHKKPNEEHPYGLHRAVGIARVVAAVAPLILTALPPIYVGRVKDRSRAVADPR